VYPVNEMFIFIFVLNGVVTGWEPQVGWTLGTFFSIPGDFFFFWGGGGCLNMFLKNRRLSLLLVVLSIMYCYALLLY